MPLFESSSGVTINGGHFIDVAGDMNVHPEPMGQPLTALEFGWIETKRQLSGPQSNGWNIGAGNGGVLPNLLTFYVSNAESQILYPPLPNQNHCPSISLASSSSLLKKLTLCLSLTEKVALGARRTH
jgi:hypothetical protein